MIELGANLSALVERFEGSGPMSGPALARRAVAMLDLTRLDQACDEQAVAALCRSAETPVGAGCRALRSAALCCGSAGWTGAGGKRRADFHGGQFSRRRRRRGADRP